MTLRHSLFALLCMSQAACISQAGGTRGTESGTELAMVHGFAVHEQGFFCGWPANNGVWTWDDGREILVGYSYGTFAEQEGHNVTGGDVDRLSRSTDGGVTWSVQEPVNYVPDDNELSPAPGGVLFSAPGFALRVKRNCFLISYDRGKSWEGGYQFDGLMEAPELKGMVNTSRTGYIVMGPASCLLFMSAEPAGTDYEDRTFVAETTDGGKTFHFVSWVTPLDDPYRAVMPSPVRLADGAQVVALRRRIPDADAMCWIDCYQSKDNGRSWAFLSKAAETGLHNGNPPALAVMKDGRVACTYGDRTRHKMYLRLSEDGGRTWQEEIPIRDDFALDKFGEKDFGYPRLVQNHRGELVCMYYWATKKDFHQHIAVTRVTP